MAANINTTATLESVFGIEGAALPLDQFMGPGTNVPDDQVNESFVFDKGLVKRALVALAGDGVTPDNLLLWGDAGTGKTDFCVQFAARLSRPVFVLSIGEETSIRQLIGGYSLKGGETSFAPGALLQAVQTRGAVIVFDEINMAPPGVAAMLNHLLQSREIFIPETGEVVKAAEDVAFFATANTSLGIDETGLYAGSQEQNGATRSRFAYARVGYLPEEKEIELIQKRFPGVDEIIPSPDPEGGRTFSEVAVQLATSLRAAVADGRISLPYSMRQQLRFVQSTLLMASTVEAFKYAYWDGLDSIERQAAADIFFAVFGQKVDD